MKLVTAAQMQAIDRRAIDGIGIPGLELMENAGRSIAHFIKEIFKQQTNGKKVAIFCGKGNNGGDGFVVARYLQSWGVGVQVFIFASISQLKGDALVNYKRIKNLDLEIIEVIDAGFLPAISGVDLLIDAFFGTGFQGEITGLIKENIGYINDSAIPIVAVDTPSGLNNDTGEVTGTCVRADYTASLALPKLGQYLYPGRSYCGQIRICDIGIPQEAIQAERLPLSLITPGMVGGLIPKRLPTAHKGECGKIFVLAGSVGMTGAATLAADAALKAGAGLVRVGLPASLNDIVATKLTEAITIRLPELRKRRCLALRALGQILEQVERADALCLGPGVGRHFETGELFCRLLPKLNKPAVLDADGLFPFSENSQPIKDCNSELALTPHLGEFSRLTGKTTREIEADKIAVLTEYTAEINKVVLLKGAPTLIANPEGDVYLSPTGNPGMATAGSGDVLTGIIGALLGLGMRAIDAACCGAFLHGFAGDIAQKSVGTFGMTAGDILNAVPRAFKSIKN